MRFSNSVCWNFSASSLWSKDRYTSFATFNWNFPSTDLMEQAPLAPIYVYTRSELTKPYVRGDPRVVEAYLGAPAGAEGGE